MGDGKKEEERGGGGVWGGRGRVVVVGCGRVESAVVDNGCVVWVGGRQGVEGWGVVGGRYKSLVFGGVRWCPVVFGVVRWSSVVFGPALVRTCHFRRASASVHYTALVVPSMCFGYFVSVYTLPARPSPHLNIMTNRILLLSVVHICPHRQT